MKVFMTFSENSHPDATVYSYADLKRDPFFWPRHGAFLEANPHIELWKPYLIQKKMRELVDGDSLLYTDPGVSVTQFPSPTSPVVGITINEPEGVWTKMDLFLKLKALHLADTNQLLTAAVLIYVCPETRRLVNKWYTLACDYHNVDNSPSTQRDLPDFREHLDRSLFSLLVKTHPMK
jgi:hypothetical protein